MPKTIRISDPLASRLEALASEEHRSLSNLAALLLERALELDTLPITKTIVSGGGRVVAQVSTTPQAERHFKPDPKS